MKTETSEATTKIITVRDGFAYFFRRLVVRFVDEARVAREVLKEAKKSGKPELLVEFGGDVANAYGYPADTEAVVAAAYPDGTVLLWTARIPANKATLAGAASIAPFLRPLFDKRYSAEKGKAARARFVELCRRIKEGESEGSAFNYVKQQQIVAA